MKKKMLDLIFRTLFRIPEASSPLHVYCLSNFFLLVISIAILVIIIIIIIIIKIQCWYDELCNFICSNTDVFFVYLIMHVHLLMLSLNVEAAL